MFSDEYVLSTVVATPEVKYDNFLRFLLYIGKIVVTSFESVREASEWQPTPYVFSSSAVTNKTFRVSTHVASTFSPSCFIVR